MFAGMDLDVKNSSCSNRFNKMVLVDIREYYEDASGQDKPTKKGFWLLHC